MSTISMTYVITAFILGSESDYGVVVWRKTLPACLLFAKDASGENPPASDPVFSSDNWADAGSTQTAPNKSRQMIT